MMKSSFMHLAVTNEEATHLVETYRRTGAHAEKTLNVSDPRLWDVAVRLTEQRCLRPTPRSMVNKMWG